MKAQIAAVSRIVHAPTELIYRIIADYRKEHPRILPDRYFLSLEVEQGGYGAGTIINFNMRILGRTQTFRSLITEPEPGRWLVETDMKSKTPTTFQVLPTKNDSISEVIISTEFKGRNWLEGLLAKFMLEKIYRQELDLLANLAEGRARAMQSPSSEISNS